MGGWGKLSEKTFEEQQINFVFHSNKESYWQYRLKNNYDQFLRNKIRNVVKMMKIAKVLFLEQKYLKIE